MVATVSVNMHAVTVVDGDSSRVVLTLNGDTESILETAKVDLKEGDEVISQVAARSGAIEINRAFDVQVDGRRVYLRGPHDRWYGGGCPAKSRCYPG